MNNILSETKVMGFIELLLKFINLIEKLGLTSLENMILFRILN